MRRDPVEDAARPRVDLDRHRTPADAHAHADWPPRPLSGRVVLEGLPGAGKTTTIGAIRRELPEFTCLPEIVLEPTAAPDLGFFVRNDIEKARLVGAIDRAVLDRYWISTVAYVLAERALVGEPAVEVDDLVGSLYGGRLASVDVVVFLDSRRALDTAYASDGRFADAGFRRLLRVAYDEVLGAERARVVVLRSDGREPADVALDVVAALADAHAARGDG